MAVGRSVEALHGQELLRYRRSLPPGPLYAGIYIDDLAVLGMVPLRSSLSPSLPEVVARKADRVYEDNRLVRSVKKDITGASEGKSPGVTQAEQACSMMPAASRPGLHDDA